MPSILLGAACPVDHIPEVTITGSIIRMAIHKVILWQLKKDSNQPEQLSDDVVIDEPVKPLNLLVVPQDHFRV